MLSADIINENISIFDPLQYKNESCYNDLKFSFH